jgi:hypothetical protein
LLYTLSFLILGYGKVFRISKKQKWNFASLFLILSCNVDVLTLCCDSTRNGA